MAPAHKPAPASESQTDGSLDELLEQMGAVKSDLQKLSTQFLRYIGRDGEHLSQYARDALSEFNDALSRYGIDTEALAKTARERTAGVRRMAAKEVRRNPLQSAAILVGVGLVLGALLRRH